MAFLSLLGVTAVFSSAAFLLAARKIRGETLTFEHFVTLDDDELVPLSIAVAAKDEGHTIGPALSSLLELEYPELEIVLVDDRSTDDTFGVAERIKRTHPRGERLKLLRCDSLPAGWLGKVHALHLAVKECRHPLILLTDADVHFAPDSLKRAVSIQRVLDCPHLVAAPLIEAKGFWEPLLTSFFLVLFAVRFQPSLVHRRPKSYVGVGAFNLLTREALERVEYLTPLRLQITDDVHLGRLVKSRGLRQYCVIADSFVRVRWFEGFSGIVRGLEKNAYAGLNYSLGYAIFCIFGLLFGAFAPLLLATAGYLWWGLACWLFQGLVGLTIPASCRLPRWVGLFFPLAALALAYTFARSAWLTEKRKGVSWRDTHYSLSALRREHHRFLEEEASL